MVPNQRINHRRTTQYRRVHSGNPGHGPVLSTQLTRCLKSDRLISMDKIEGVGQNGVLLPCRPHGEEEASLWRRGILPRASRGPWPHVDRGLTWTVASQGPWPHKDHVAPRDPRGLRRRPDRLDWTWRREVISATTAVTAGIFGQKTEHCPQRKGGGVGWTHVHSL